MFKVVITDRALKDIDNLTQDVKKRIASKLKEYSNGPLNYSRKLTQKLALTGSESEITGSYLMLKMKPS
jgi:mRNA-degrading endonuclease RelE of RelBE toxin-antitoxin system